MEVQELTVNEQHVDSNSTDVFGFWLYIMTDCILFGCLFITFLVLNYESQYVSNLKHYVNLFDVLIETLLLLTSSFTFGLAILNLYQNKLFEVQIWLILTFILGLGFILFELTEFIHLAIEGFRWDVSGQASSFFTLVGTHGLHVSFGLLWILLMIFQVSLIKNNTIIMRRMTYLGLFWSFLDIVWIFLFTIVYLMGAM